MMHVFLVIPYRIAGNFRGIKYSLFLWAGWPPRNFNVGVAYRNVGMPCSHETKRNFYSRIPPFLELNEFFTPRNLPAIRYCNNCRLIFIHAQICRLTVSGPSTSAQPDECTSNTRSAIWPGLSSMATSPHFTTATRYRITRIFCWWKTFVKESNQQKIWSFAI